ncbi:MAG: MFS transporter [Spirochaetales bacterium]|nr:MFS transporter [Spirochaetales bacterium]
MLRFAWLNVVLYASVSVLFPYLPVYFEVRGLRPSQIGLLLGAVEVAGICAPFLITPLADRSGRYRSLMAILILLSSASLFLMHQSQLFSIVLVAVTVFGITYRPQLPLTDAIVGHGLADATKDFGKVRLWGTVSFIVISLFIRFTGVFSEASNNRLFLSFQLSLLLFLLALPLVPPVQASPKKTGGACSQSKRNEFKILLPLIVIGFLGNIGFGAYQSFAPLYFTRVAGASAVAGFYAVAAVAEIPAMLFAGRIVKKIGHRGMIIIAFVASILRWGLMALELPPRLLVMSQLLHCGNYALFLLAGIDWVNTKIHPERRAWGMGVVSAFCFGAPQFLGSLAGGYLLEHGGFARLFGTAALFPALALLWILFDQRILKDSHLDGK